MLTINKFLSILLYRLNEQLKVGKLIMQTQEHDNFLPCKTGREEGESYEEKDRVISEPIKANFLDKFDDIRAGIRREVKKAGITKADVDEAIKSVRNS